MPGADSRQPEHPPDSMWHTYFVAVVSAYSAELVTYPMDLTKTRLQVQGELANKADEKLAKAPYRGMTLTAVGIVREEGFFKLYKGISAQFCRHLIYSGTRMVTYRKIREKLMKNPDDPFPLWESAICGLTAGGIGQWLANPADLVKVQLQMEGKRELMGFPRRVHGVTDAFIKVVQTSGVTGLWRGAVPNIQRSALVNLGDLTTYDTVKHFLLRNTTLQDGTATHVLSSLSAGLVAAIMGTPADTVKTRMMNQPVDKEGQGGLYRGSWHCCVTTVRNEGFFALYKGFLPNWLRMAPWSLTFWLVFENISPIVGVKTF